MFARWRNLAAAAGAIWFPFASAQASPDRNDLRYDTPCTRNSACAEYHDDATTNPWQTYERESWYQQYYGNSLIDPTSISGQPETPSYEDTYSTGNDDSFSGQSVPEFDEPEIVTTDQPAAVLEPRIEEPTPAIDSEGRCDDLTCPCHDIIDLDSDSPIPPETASSDDRACPADSSHPGCFDVFEPYSFDEEYGDEPLPETAPKAVLCGTIEPIFEDCDEDAMNECVEQSPESTFETGDIFDDAESTSTDECADDVKVETQGAREDFENDSADQNPRFHMFYPGCDWSPYLPVEGECGNPGAPGLDQIESSSTPDSVAHDSQELTSEVD